MELAQFYPPYADVTPMRALILITRNPPPKLGEGFSANFNDFIAKCLQKNPDERPDAMTLLRHPFITKAPDASAAMKPILEFSENYRSRAKKGEAPLTRSKRVPPTTPPPVAPPAGSKKADPFDFDDEGEDDGTVIYKKNPSMTQSGRQSDDGTVVVHNAEQSDGTVVFHNADVSDGTVVVHPAQNSNATQKSIAVKTNRQAAAVGSWARVRAAMKRHVTIVSPTAPDNNQGGLVSKRDFFFIIVGAVTYMLISHMLRSVFGG